MLQERLIPIAIAFNAASLHSVYNGGPLFTADDPLLDVIVLFLFAALLRVSAGDGKLGALGGPVAFVGFALALTGGVTKHLMSAKTYVDAEAYHSCLWVPGVILNVATTFE